MTGISEEALFFGYRVPYDLPACPCAEYHCHQPRSERPGGLCDDCAAGLHRKEGRQTKD